MKFIKLVLARRIIIIFVFMLTTPVFSHGGRTNSEGCHNQTSTGEYHCHRKKAEALEQNKIIRNESFYNNLLASSLNAQSETRYNYQWDNGNSYVRVDVETNDFVIEGGLDKRSSLDSLQQAIFASTISGKKPAIVIYDTDGIEGRFEFRIKKAATRAGVIYRRLTEEQIRVLTSFP